MTAVPDNSVDVVVMTLVLCSVTDVGKIMQQILRVLAPVSVMSVCLFFSVSSLFSFLFFI